MQNSLRIVYMGTPDFAVEPLRQLIESGVEVAAVVTVPDKQAGRGQKIHESTVKQFAKEKGLPILQPERLRDELFINTLRTLNADLFIVVAFRMLPEMVWSIPRFGTINLHASLLPQYRGAAPINWAIINGETKTGVTTFLISHEIDTGDILLQDTVEIRSGETAGELHDELMRVGANLLVKTVWGIKRGEIAPQPQLFNTVLKDAPKLNKSIERIKWNDTAELIYNKIRGLSPYPAAWSEMVSSEDIRTSVKIYKADFELINHTLEVGTIVSDNKNYIKVACSNGFVFINELQLAGKKRLTTKNFLAGFRNVDNFFFE